MKRRPLDEGEEFDDFAALWTPVEQVFPEHRCLQKAVAKGQLLQIKGPVVAGSMKDAMAQLQPEAPEPKAKKSGGND